jgi:hypothetical protein
MPAIARKLRVFKRLKREEILNPRRMIFPLTAIRSGLL